MRFLLALLLFPSFMIFAGADGIYLGRTRVIFNSLHESESLPVTNASSKSTWLLRSWITDANSDSKSNGYFLITPPLYRLDPDNTINLKINKLSGVLPKNKESLFYVNVMSIPPTSSNNNSSQLTLAINNKIKMFYRPDNIDDAKKIQDAYNNIKIKKGSSGLNFINPSPYYITLTDVTYNGKTNNDNNGFMLSPFSELNIACNGLCNNVKFKIINDFGGLTAEKSLKI
ncbi:fimbrial biogenesis chaperone [Hafnia paralvei]|uniref:fimbrial biogenesis chaperone n=1 Tax=Hafnia paralvei TaxID=546367 RepID=UPI0010353129|nr:molecular chaperone [Hafnia paralvei]TBL64321.1 molecular chaperone [Hafnia paralvei]